jgi:hypothetical protein
MRPTLAGLLAIAALTFGAACGGSPIDPGSDPPPPPANQPPVIDSITLSGGRIEIDGDVTVTASVRDAETAIDQLTFEWAADGGTFSGQGPTVTWRPPSDAVTPADFVIRLTVRELYGTAPAGGTRPEHRITRSSDSIRVHDSPRELGDLALRFLTDFANSAVSADSCVREFSDGCRGKADERSQIEDNRQNYEILSSSLRLKGVSVAANRLTGAMTVDCGFTSRIKRCVPGISNCSVGGIERVAGDCLLTGVYEQNRWWLCDSNFSGSLVPSMRLFFGVPR